MISGQNSTRRSSRTGPCLDLGWPFYFNRCTAASFALNVAHQRLILVGFQLLHATRFLNPREIIPTGFVHSISFTRVIIRFSSPQSRGAQSQLLGATFNVSFGLKGGRIDRVERWQHCFSSSSLRSQFTISITKRNLQFLLP